MVKTTAWFDLTLLWRFYHTICEIMFCYWFWTNIIIFELFLWFRLEEMLLDEISLKNDFEAAIV